MTIHWQMEPYEKLILKQLVQSLTTRKLAVEIGTYYGGCLDYLRKMFNFCIAVDLDHSFLDPSLRQCLDIQLVSGPSETALPLVIDQLNNMDLPCTFFLVDADHEYNAVMQDLHAIARYKPKEPGIILIHDADYPPSARAIQNFSKVSPWTVNPHFSPGLNKLGGFALIEFKP